ncbi:LPXTG cell wall anchor domain-containing protein [Candidatus Pacearchaeota archaeon]|nr:LPXTG cell wall anchor domain-containing protein [Candidatus Pacearchaeota archaeon]
MKNNYLFIIVGVMVLLLILGGIFFTFNKQKLVIKYVENLDGITSTDENKIKEIIGNDFFSTEQGKKCKSLETSILLSKWGESDLNAVVACGCTPDDVLGSVCLGEWRYRLSRTETSWIIVSSGMVGRE